MYVPAHFAASDEDVASLLDGAHVVDLISPTADGLVATPLPMLFEGTSLVGHVARNNPHWRDAVAGESLVIARGPDAYVSPSWYATKREHGRVVPTWNYLTAHVYGELVVHDDVEWLRALVTRPASWRSVSRVTSAFIEGQLRAIVGVELRITRLEAKAKLSQNRVEADRAGVIAGLDGHPIAGLMRER
ncbi:MAG TPA: FMN-binding negative transcriptional regulator [Jatrophihabitantaceae bacterium]|nr:FMN-binding negative transcriptional regulator [Jatrophihabitantaceae bacterium]